MTIPARFIICIAAVFLYAGTQPERVKPARADQGRPLLQTAVQAQWLYRGIYVDKYAEMAGDVAKENDFLRWCQKYDFNVLTLYGMGKVLRSPPLRPALADFIRRAKGTYGIGQVSAVVTKAVTVTDLIDSYNNDRSNSLSRFDYTNLELEWWNNATDFENYDADLQQMQQWGKKQSPVVPNEEYIGWFKNPEGEDSLMASRLVQHSSRILVHDYQPNFTFSYLQSRLDWIGRAARAQGKIMPVIIIFSPRQEFSAEYFKAHSFGDAWQWVTAAFRDAQFPGKDHVQLIGYQIYNQTYARECKP
jgi:hypothetical protein